jgi:hypothetical protein
MLKHWDSENGKLKKEVEMGRFKLQGSGMFGLSK